MDLNLHCSHCGGSFPLPPHSRTAAVLAHMEDEGPWSALGDGETIEDKLSRALCDECFECPECGHLVGLGEEGLGEFTQALLAHW